MFDIVETTLPGCRQLLPTIRGDARGRFVKVFHEEAFAAAGLPTGFAEQYSSTSRQGVLRGLHFQTPPRSPAKLARVTQGKALDVVVDLRQGSPTYGQHTSMVLAESDRLQVFIPSGFAHGFCTLEDNTEMAYKLSDHFSREHARGILWNDPDLGIDWPVTESEAILSERDHAYPRLKALGPVFHMPSG